MYTQPKLINNFLKNKPVLSKKAFKTKPPVGIVFEKYYNLPDKEKTLLVNEFSEKYLLCRYIISRQHQIINYWGTFHFSFIDYRCPHDFEVKKKYFYYYPSKNYSIVKTSYNERLPRWVYEKKIS